MTLQEKIAAMDLAEKEALSSLLGTKESMDDVLAELEALGVSATAGELEAYRQASAAKKPLADEELSGIVGGSFYSLENFFDESKVTFVCQKGDKVQVSSGWGFGSTVECEIMGVRSYLAGVLQGRSIYRDEYLCKEVVSHWYFNDMEWHMRNDIQKP